MRGSKTASERLHYEKEPLLTICLVQIEDLVRMPETKKRPKADVAESNNKVLKVTWEYDPYECNCENIKADFNRPRVLKSTCEMRRMTFFAFLLDFKRLRRSLTT
ncbi:hypothetical protein RUM43_009713 [Polyplax serrata]|uniref:Uncharacterized protein n=1 Tax=Polyplax serrata TaxID=468196 RepID=A0AAN8PUR1_POLSC